MVCFVVFVCVSVDFQLYCVCVRVCARVVWCGFEFVCACACACGNLCVCAFRFLCLFESVCVCVCFHYSFVCRFVFNLVVPVT